MKHSIFCTYYNQLSFRYSKRAISGVLLVSLIVVQAKIMLTGCLVMPYLPALQSMEAMEGSCAEPASPKERVCLANCEYSISKPKLAGEITLFDIIVDLPAIMFVTGLFINCSSCPSDAVFMPAIGPPFYLLFLRFFIPIPSSPIDRIAVRLSV